MDIRSGFAALVIAAVLLAGCRGAREPRALDPGIWLALAQVPAEAHGSPPPMPIRVLDVVSGKERDVGPASLYARIAWSPQGHRLAALGLDEADDAEDNSTVVLRTWDGAGTLLGEYAFPRGDPFEIPDALEWSPDGERLAVVTNRRVLVFNSRGKEAGSTAITGVFGTGGGGPLFGLGSPWSPGSRRFATLANELIIVTGRDGTGRQLDLPTRPQLRSSAWIRGWASDDAVELVVEAAGQFPEATLYTGTIEPASIRWDEGKPFDNGSRVTQLLARGERLSALVPGMQQWDAGVTSADRTAYAAVLSRREPDDLAPTDTVVIVEYQEQTTVVQLSPAPRHPGIPAALVVVPGWQGPLPATRDAARAVTAPPPRPTPTDPPPGTPYPDKGPGYPAPKGDRVKPQVDGLPVYPGSREIDGFTKDFEGTPASVQMFALPGDSAGIVAWFFQELEALGFHALSRGTAAGGEQATFIRGRDRVLVTTQYIPRKEDERPRDAVPYGFQGAGRFEETINGEAFFFVVTARAP